MLQRIKARFYVTNCIFLLSISSAIGLDCSLLQIKCGTSPYQWCCRYNQYCGDSYGSCTSSRKTTTSPPPSTTPATSWIIAAVVLIFFGCLCPIIYCCFCKKGSMLRIPTVTYHRPAPTPIRYVPSQRIGPAPTHVPRVWSVYNDEAPPPSYDAAIADLHAKHNAENPRL